jgi:hypothetical protein
LGLQSVPEINFTGINMKKINIIVFLIVLIVLSACSSQKTSTTSSKTEMTFETIGIRGSTALITLNSPKPEAVTSQDLANRLREDWQNQLKLNTNPNYQNQVHVMVFDNKDAPQKWLDNWNNLSAITDEEWSNEIYTHWIATYDRNTTSGLNEVQILSGDDKASVVETIKF